MLIAIPVCVFLTRDGLRISSIKQRGAAAASRSVTPSLAGMTMTLVLGSALTLVSQFEGTSQNWRPFASR
ncbi:hypothetical protein D9M71_806000 [compost metagenome]